MQECIPVGCVLPTSVAISLGQGCLLRRCLPRRCLLWGVSSPGVSSLGVSSKGDVCQGDVCLGGLSAQGCLPMGMSAQGVSIHLLPIACWYTPPPTPHGQKEWHRPVKTSSFCNYCCTHNWLKIVLPTSISNIVFVNSS